MRSAAELSKAKRLWEFGKKGEERFTPFCGQVQSQSNMPDACPQPGTTMSMGSREQRPAAFSSNTLPGGGRGSAEPVSQVLGKRLMDGVLQASDGNAESWTLAAGEWSSQRDLPV